jgi:hypothetical protein
MPRWTMPCNAAAERVAGESPPLDVSSGFALRDLLDGNSALRKLAGRALPTLALRAVIPAVLFLVGRSAWGLGGAVMLTLAWNVGLQAIRGVQGQPLSAILLLGMAELAIRSSAALALHSARAYFVAPAVMTAIVGAAFIATAFTSRPLAARVFWEIVPDTVIGRDDPRAARLLRNASVLYGSQQMAVAGVSILMLSTMSTTSYVAIHPMLSWVALGLLALAATPMLRRHLSHLPAHDHETAGGAGAGELVLPVAPVSSILAEVPVSSAYAASPA